MKTNLHPEYFPDNTVLVYGANLAGRHGAGSAKVAKELWGAEYGKWGFSGKSYGIPTKDENLKTLPLDKIAEYVNEFVKFAEANPQYRYYFTAIGTGLAGYDMIEIARMLEYNTDLGICKADITLDPELSDTMWNVVVWDFEEAYSDA